MPCTHGSAFRRAASWLGLFAHACAHRRPLPLAQIILRARRPNEKAPMGSQEVIQGGRGCLRATRHEACSWLSFTYGCAEDDALLRIAQRAQTLTPRAFHILEAPVTPRREMEMQRCVRRVVKGSASMGLTATPERRRLQIRQGPGSAAAFGSGWDIRALI